MKTGRKFFGNQILYILLPLDFRGHRLSNFHWRVQIDLWMMMRPVCFRASAAAAVNFIFCSKLGRIASLIDQFFIFRDVLSDTCSNTILYIAYKMSRIPKNRKTRFSS
jgi:hypothetical protein